jgi:hypothetical protein
MKKRMLTRLCAGGNVVRNLDRPLIESYRVDERGNNVQTTC